MIKSFKLFEVAQIKGMNEVQVMFDDTDYEIVFIVKDNDVVGFVNEGMQSTIMEKKNIHTIGTIWGPGYGELLYALAIAKFGPIVPSGNISDKAKESHKRRLENPNFIKYKIPGIGVYTRTGEESYLNTIFDLDPETKQFLRSKITHNDDKDLSKKLLDKFFYIKDEMHRNYQKYYTKGASKYRAGERF